MNSQPQENSDVGYIRPVIVSEFSPPALTCIRSWGRQSLSVGMICIRNDTETRPDSRYLSAYKSLHPKDIYTPKGIRIIDEFLRRFRATGVMAINEDITCWLNDNPELMKSGTAFWMPRNQIIKNILSKKKQLEAAEQVGFKILPTYHITKDPDSMKEIPESDFPLCLRPDHSKTVHPFFKIRLADDRENLIRWVKTLDGLDKPLLAQPFMNLPNMVIHGARTLSGRTIGLQPFLVDRKFQGVTLTIRPTKTDESLLKKCAAFTDYFELVGNYHFEFLYDRRTKEAYFLEINGRMGGTTAKVYACGYDEPLIALEAYGACDNRDHDIRNRTVTGKHALLKYCLHAIGRKLTPLDYPTEPNNARILRSIYGFFMHRDEILTFCDIRGSMAFYRSLIRNLCGGTTRQP